MVDKRSAAFEPIVGGARDGVETGYRALESVLEGLRESLRRVAPPRAEKETARAAATPRSADVPAVDDLFGLLARALRYASELADDLADALGTVGDDDDRESPTTGSQLEAEPVLPGETATVLFHVHNRTPNATGVVTFSATALHGDAGAIGSDAVRFDPEGLERIGPWDTHEITVAVDVPEEAAPGIYRGTVHAIPGDAWAVVVIEVLEGPTMA